MMFDRDERQGKPRLGLIKCAEPTKNSIQGFFCGWCPPKSNDVSSDLVDNDDTKDFFEHSIPPKSIDVSILSTYFCNYVT